MNGANILDEQVCACHWHHQHLYGFQYQQYQKKSNQLKGKMVILFVRLMGRFFKSTQSPLSRESYPPFSFHFLACHHCP